MILSAVNLLQFALIAVAGLGVVLTISQPRLRAASALMLMSVLWMVFNFLEEVAGFRGIWLVTPAFRLAYPPLVYLVARGVMLAGPGLRWRDWPHALPFLVALFLTPWVGLVEHAARLSLFAYSAATIVMIHRFHQATRETRSDAQTIQLNWMVGLIAFYVVDGIFDMARMDARWLHPYWPWLGIQSAYVFQIAISLVFVCVLIVLAVRHGRLFTGLDDGSLVSWRGRPIRPVEAGAGSATDADHASTYQRIDAVVRGEALYTEPRLTRQEVATAARLTERAVSVAIKSETGRNFNDYINALRIEDVCAMMKEDAAGPTRSRLIDLAYTAGFSSKSVFNSVFKRETGQTPSAYAAALTPPGAGPASSPAKH
ncbi:helix-turn-helix transcriptional regulator [Maricaulis maris]|jgi:AraC-like DNA-binding protein|uniref:helix-turn-helix transcriptional regulator n=1 Tax=Maricaulis maris TaxID=74318 RepID=UPI0026ED8F94|nr:helix-turn-helix transcriptional regulator [Maricaulis maris]